jgi:superfamily II DNA or RNA helicase
MKEIVLFPDENKPLTRAGITPRRYQNEAHDEFFRLTDAGIEGVLVRLFTGGGKTLLACLIADTWLRRSDNHRVMIVSYERQLVWQFAQEVEDYLGVTPGIEMESKHIDPNRIPKISVVSRASLLPAKPPTPAQVEELASFGVKELGAIPERAIGKYLRFLRKGGDAQSVIDEIAHKNTDKRAHGKTWSRLHKFDWRLNWLVVYDEAHRHAHNLKSVGHIVEWFAQNPTSKMLGPTATPKLSSKVSLGHKMFPGIALDYPLYSETRPCAVKEGYAVPYVQKYIEVEGVDFKQIKRMASGDFDEKALERALGEEGQIAKLVTPLLDLAGDRRFLIFNPGVEMSKNVARFINARHQARCECGIVRWYPKALIGDGAACECGRFIGPGHVLKSGVQCKQLDGDTPDDERKEVYLAHQKGAFQFLSVCGLCREGYNDPDLAGVAVFRPVSKKASSLAEQMKGRSCRPLRAIARLLHTLPDAEARRKAIADSAKPTALIVDLVGITGLADCASTVEIYAEGLPDEIKERAKEILEEKSQEEEVDVHEAIEQAKQEAEAAKEKIRKEREEAEKRAKEEFEKRSRADAQAKYTAHDMGHGRNVNSNTASSGHVKMIERLGMELIGFTPSKKVATRITKMLKLRKQPHEVAMLNGLKADQWHHAGPTENQIRTLEKNHLMDRHPKNSYEASMLLDAKLSPDEFVKKNAKEFEYIQTPEELDIVRENMKLVRGILPQSHWNAMCVMGRQKRDEVCNHGDAYEGDNR